MPHPSWRTWISGVVLGLALVLLLSLASSSASCDPSQPGNACSEHYALSRGDLSPVGGYASSSTASLRESSLPTAGALTYEDFVQVESHARALLQSNLTLREDISPYKTNRPKFESLVRGFDVLAGTNVDINAGFNSKWDQAKPNPDPTNTIRYKLETANAELIEARDLYAFLAVYAPVEKFRADSGRYGDLCDEPENPNPVDPTLPGLVLDPVIDWCNFPARLRQSVREAAYLRMIFGQQFTANAVGVNFFSANMVGGEPMVRKEIAWLAGAVDQYEKAEASVSSGLKRMMGSGCRVSDFYTQSEWALLSRAVEGKELAQHHMAVRRSYLDITSVPAVVQQAQDEAQDILRVSTIAQYVQTIGAAGETVAAPPAHCNAPEAERPDGDMVAKMVFNMLETREQSREMREGRNVFGFDLRFTPARPYHTQGVEGLYEEARRLAFTAADYQATSVDQNRQWDVSQTELINQIGTIKHNYDLQLASMTGCDSNGGDDPFLTCVRQTAEILQGCLVKWPQDWPEASYQSCVAQRPTGQLRQAVDNLRTAYLRVQRVKKAIDNIPARIDVERWQSVEVRGEIMGAAYKIGAIELAASLAESVQIVATVGPGGQTGMHFNPYAAIAGGLRATGDLVRAIEQAEITDINAAKAIRALLLEEAELESDLAVAVQEFNAQGTQFATLAADIGNLAVERERARGYLEVSPANDPSFRLVLDSTRITLAGKLEEAARMSYLAARRAEYECAVSLSFANFRFSNIYRARTAQDIINFLDALVARTNSLRSCAADYETRRVDYSISVAQDLLGLTDEYLGLQGPAARTERIRRFREWVRQNTYPNDSISAKPVLRFRFSTSLSERGLLATVVGPLYSRSWLQRMVGIADPTGNIGLGIDLSTDQAGILVRRNAVVTQGGQLQMRSQERCVFDYNLIHPSILLGFEKPPDNQQYSLTADLEASVQGENGNPTPGFSGRPIAASDWEVTIYSDGPSYYDDMDFQKLTDIVLFFPTTKASELGSADPPSPDECVRVDF